MKTIVSMFIFAMFFINSAIAQESTREEFVEFCKANQGRWIGEITWLTDWPGLGKKGDRVTAYWEGVIIEDGNALHGRFFAGSGSATYVVIFDAGAKQIKGTWVDSGGSISHDVISKKNGKFVEHQLGSKSDGTKTEFTATMTLEENGTKISWHYTGTVGGKKIDDTTDAWRKLSK